MGPCPDQEGLRVFHSKTVFGPDHLSMIGRVLDRAKFDASFVPGGEARLDTTGFLIANLERIHRTTSSAGIHPNRRRTQLTPSTTQESKLTLSEQHQIIVNAFYNARYGVSPTATRGAVESYARKHNLAGAEYTAALESAISAGLVATMADAALAIRNAGRAMLPKR